MRKYFETFVWDANARYYRGRYCHRHYELINRDEQVVTLRDRASGAIRTEPVSRFHDRFYIPEQE